MAGILNYNSGPLVTVLISTYNRPEYLRFALRSIFNQTYKNFEIILTRDGGMPVRDAIAEFLDDPRLIFVDRDENRGLPYSFNQALYRAKGEYICYLGDDDVLFPFHIEVLLNAMLSQDQCQVVYGDLYKAHCRVLGGGRRRVLSKNVEISRDYDRMLMLQFNHALHVSLLHRKDVFEKAGYYNEDLNVMIDWDLTRKLCFYTDFMHVPIVTGEYYAPVGDCDRISIQRRKDVNEYLRNVLTIRSTRPPKPWPCMKDLSVIMMADRCDGQLYKTISDLWSHGYYPKQIFVPLTDAEKGQFQSSVPNLVTVGVDASMNRAQRVDAILPHCQGDYAALVPVGMQIENDEVSFIERSLYPFLKKNETNAVYEIVEATESLWAAVLSLDNLKKIRKQRPDLGIREGVLACGLELKKPDFEDYPFQFDNFLTVAGQLEKVENWSKATQVYEHIEEHCGNIPWMQTLRANAMCHQGHYEESAQLLRQLNESRPTIARLMIEARTHLKRQQWNEAINYYRRAEAILEGTCDGYDRQLIDMVLSGQPTRMQETTQQQETLVWTH
ncbi:MAG: glycosyltransferase [Planctomycetota bacterium]